MRNFSPIVFESNSWRADKSPIVLAICLEGNYYMQWTREMNQLPVSLFILLSCFLNYVPKLIEQLITDSRAFACVTIIDTNLYVVFIVCGVILYSPHDRVNTTY